MKLTEKTLELNITHELLSLGDGLWPLLHHAADLMRLGWARPVPATWRPPVPVHPLALGLTLVEEERKGYDVEIKIPQHWRGQPVATFIQFKKGEAKTFGHAPSLFAGSRFKPKPFLQFGINNNSTKTQHRRLRQLSRHFQHQRPVLYAFPRILNHRQLKAMAGHLLCMTTFVDVRELDRLARARVRPVNLGDNKVHHFRISRRNLSDREARSEFVDLRQLEDVTPDFIGEILALRVSKSLNEWSEYYSSAYAHGLSLRADQWSYVFERFIHRLQLYWAIPSQFRGYPENEGGLTAEQYQLDDMSQKYSNWFYKTLLDEVSEDKKKDDAFAQVLDEDLRARKHTFERILQHLSPFQKLLQDSAWFKKQIPKPDLKLALPLNESAVKIKMSTLESDPGLIKDLAGINMQLY